MNPLFGKKPLVSELWTVAKPEPQPEQEETLEPFTPQNLSATLPSPSREKMEKFEALVVCIPWILSTPILLFMGLWIHSSKAPLGVMDWIPIYIVLAFITYAIVKFTTSLNKIIKRSYLPGKLRSFALSMNFLFVLLSVSMIFYAGWSTYHTTGNTPERIQASNKLVAVYNQDLKASMVMMQKVCTNEIATQFQSTWTKKSFVSEWDQKEASTKLQTAAYQQLRKCV